MKDEPVRNAAGTIYRSTEGGVANLAPGVVVDHGGAAAVHHPCMSAQVGCRFSARRAGWEGSTHKCALHDAAESMIIRKLSMVVDSYRAHLG